MSHENGKNLSKILVSLESLLCFPVPQSKTNFILRNSPRISPEIVENSLASKSDSLLIVPYLSDFLPYMSELISVQNESFAKMEKVGTYFSPIHY